MALLFKSDVDRPDSWIPALRTALPGMEVRKWPEVGDPAEIDYALVWQPPEGFLASLPHLKAILSIGAGIDHLTRDPKLPRHLPLVRMVEPGLTSGMTEFVVMQSLFHHRRLLDYLDQQDRKVWRELAPVAAWQRRVGVMGLGELGADAVDRLVRLRFDVAGWSRSRRALPGAACFAGQEELPAFLARSDILVCLLPLTEETDSILNAQLFAQLPKGACVINVGRGEHLVEQDLLAALETGQIDSATLDVFRDEPLPPDSPFWSHPRVVVTPHIASMTIPETAAEAMAEAIRTLEAGGTPPGLVDLARGY
ncbi:2-hydroxyacid dehydrogenase [Algihabitans albus]|uniref:2-hydroxyacid dehydrogenase n=1 Tax=Algihabitans albus TaxID=2164067 RepID=UPI000E5CF5E4|nr:glyoxylate/hydroxypyruvate reductase A [Algihabitans albus]